MWMQVKSNVTTGIGVGVGIGIGIVATLAAIGMGFVWWGLSILQDEVCPRLQGDKAIVQRIGVVTSCQHSIIKSVNVTDVDTTVFEVVGSKGKGDVFVMSTSTGENGDEEYQGILLVVGGEETLVFGERPPIPLKR
jgi:hypothetical protein